MASTPEALQDIVLLQDICEPYLGMKFIVARRHHAAGTLPIKAFRLSGSRRGPLFVHNDDLAKLVEKRRKKAVAAPAPAAATNPDQLELTV
jgi:hypothetical protein